MKLTTFPLCIRFDDVHASHLPGRTPSNTKLRHKIVVHKIIYVLVFAAFPINYIYSHIHPTHAYNQSTAHTYTFGKLTITPSKSQPQTHLNETNRTEYPSWNATRARRGNAHNVVVTMRRRNDDNV